MIRQAALKHPEAVAIRSIGNGECWTAEGSQRLDAEVSYAQLPGRIHQVANLPRSLGVSSSDCVSMVLPNVPEAHYVLWGAEACGIINRVNHLLEGCETGEIVASANSFTSFVEAAPAASSNPSTASDL